MRLLAVYNTMNLGGQGNIPYYVDAIRGLLDQQGVYLKVALSACCPSQMWCIQSENTFKNHISYNYIYENLPLSVTFNDTVDKCINHFGEFDAYLYVDSGISFWDPMGRNDALKAMCDVHQSGPYAITACMPSNDDGRQWWGIEYKPGEDYVFPMGKTTNMHCQIFDKSWVKAFGRVLPDIFASHCMESVFSHMAASISRKFILTQKVHLLHNHSMDGASIGSRIQDNDRLPMSKMFETGGMLFKKKKDIDQMYQEGVELGFGIEECKEPWKHRPECFDENGYANDERLKGFLKENMYLSKEEFDYSTIKAGFVPGK